MEEEQFQACRRQAIAMLRSYNDSRASLELLQSQLREVERRTDIGVGAVRYDQPASGATNKVASIAENVLIAKEREIERLQNEIARLQGSIERVDIALAHLPPELAGLLRLRFIERKSWQSVAEVLSHDENYTRKELRQKALDRLTGVLFPELVKVNLFKGE